MISKIKTSFIIMLMTQTVSAEVVPFGEVWKKIKSSSPMQEAGRLEEKSLIESKNRASHHWLPHVYLEARSYQTNDPGNSFFGLLEQRKLEAADFNPSLLNHPDASTYTRAALGLDLPLYEGGMKSNQVSVFDYSMRAQQFASSQVELEQYAKVGQVYGSISVLDRQVEKLNVIDAEIKKLLKSYQIGQKSNPVGYSGLLGMKSLANRLAGLTEQYKAQLNAYNKALVAMGFAQSNWQPAKLPTVEYIDTYLKMSGKAGSNQLQAGKEGAKAMESMAEMERARFLPRVGAFAETYTFNGSRDSAQGYTAGLYLQWNLFDPSDFGKFNEAKLKAMASAKRIEALQQQEIAETGAVADSDRAMRVNLQLLDDSDKLLGEQMQVATTLFKNGSLSALQLVEILNRRTDIVAQQNDLELGLIKNASEGITKTDFKIPLMTQSGGQ